MNKPTGDGLEQRVVKKVEPCKCEDMNTNYHLTVCCKPTGERVQVKLAKQNSDDQMNFHSYEDTRKYLEVGKVYGAIKDVHDWHTNIIIDSRAYNSVCFEEVKPTGDGLEKIIFKHFNDHHEGRADLNVPLLANAIRKFYAEDADIHRNCRILRDRAIMEAANSSKHLCEELKKLTKVAECYRTTTGEKLIKLADAVKAVEGGGCERYN